jgi:hypothetical protein
VVDPAGDVDVVGHVGADEPETGVLQQVRDVDRRPGEEVVEAQDLDVAGQECFAQVGAEETGSAGHDGTRHGITSSLRAGRRQRTRVRSGRGP